jgi:xanthine dehydrogenase accessory factor
MIEWIDELSDLMAAGESVVVVTVANIRGSAPREVGAKMIVTETETAGTVGGGQLEYQCARIAFEMLNGDSGATLRTFPLGSSMGQCCGGVVDVLFEPIANGLPVWLRDLKALHGQREPAVVVTGIGGTVHKGVVTADNEFGEHQMPQTIVDEARAFLHCGGAACSNADIFLEPVVGSDFNIAVFGAGHVGTAVVNALSNLDCNIRWVDSRRNIFRQTRTNVRTIESPDPSLEVVAMPPDSSYLVMTHSHAIDFDIIDRILRRDDSIYCGLIGSLSKRRRFEKRYRAQEMPSHMLKKLICPIGIVGIGGKKPAEIAVAAAAEVLQAYDRAVLRTGDVFPANVRPINITSTDY